MNKRIAMISEHASPIATLGGVDSGGQNIYVAELSKHLALLGYSVDIFTRRDNDQIPKIINWFKNVRIINVDAGPAKYIRKEELLPFMGEFTTSMVDHFKKYGSYDLIHANFWMSGLVAADLKLITEIPFTITFHALGYIRKLYQGNKDQFPQERFAIENRIIKEADKIIAECPQDREDLIKYYHADSHKIALCPCGFDPLELYSIDKTLAKIKLGYQAADKIILQLGRLVPRKGIDNVIYGLSKLKKLFNMDAKLLVVGGESADPDPAKTPEIGRLQKIARREGILNQVVFTGSKKRDDLKLYYSAADIFVTTPWYEPFGITPLESMSCGTPVIGSNVGGIKYSVKNGITGLLVPPNDPYLLAGKLNYLFRHPKILRKMANEAISHVNNNFTWLHIASRISVLYEEIIQTKGLSSGRSLQLQLVNDSFNDFIRSIEKSQQYLPVSILDVADVIANSFNKKRKVLICGNGGSAADASHFTAELVGRFKNNRLGLPVISLNSDTSIITAWSNDIGFDQVFARQVESYGQAGDILIGISTSGMSVNQINAFKKAKELNMICVGILGKNGGELSKLSDLTITIPSYDTQRIQEIQMHILHTICELVEINMMEPAETAKKYPVRASNKIFLQQRKAQIN